MDTESCELQKLMNMSTVLKKRITKKKKGVQSEEKEKLEKKVPN